MLVSVSFLPRKVTISFNIDWHFEARYSCSLISFHLSILAPLMFPAGSKHHSDSCQISIFIISSTFISWQATLIRAFPFSVFV